MVPPCPLSAEQTLTSLSFLGFLSNEPAIGAVRPSPDYVGKYAFDREPKAPESVTNKIPDTSRRCQSHMIADISGVDISTLGSTTYRDLEVTDAYHFWTICCHFLVSLAWGRFGHFPFRERVGW